MVGVLVLALPLISCVTLRKAASLLWALGPSTAFHQSIRRIQVDNRSGLTKPLGSSGVISSCFSGNCL